MAKKETSPTKTLEREYVIPLRAQVRKVPRYKKSNKAIKTIKEFLARHMQVRDRDLNKIKLDLQINEIVWQRGIKKPIHKIKVKAVKEGDIVKAYSVESPDKIKFRHARIEKRETSAKAAMESKKSMMQKAKESIKAKPKDADNDGIEDKKEEVEKAKSEEIANKEMEKQLSKEMKHTTKPVSGKEKLAQKKGQDKQSRGH